MIHSLYLFGRPKLVMETDAQVHLPPSAWRLVAVLAAASGSVSRAELVDLVWPAAKLGTLRKLVWDVRKVEKDQGITIIESGDDSIGLSSKCYCDVRDLQAPRPECDPARIYRGLFADGIEADHPSWTTWIAAQRDRMRNLYIERATARLQDPSLGRSAEVFEAQRLLEVDPSNETAVRSQMLGNAMSGNAKGVEQTYYDLRARLDRSGTVPQSGTTDLFFRLTTPQRAAERPGESARSPGIPTICILRPVESRRSHMSRIIDSLVVDVSIGLCRVSLLKVIAPHTAWQVSGPAGQQRLSGIHADYVVDMRYLKHFSGQTQISIELYLHSTREIIWCDKYDISDDLTIDFYNILTAGVLRSLIRSVERRELDTFALRTDPSAYVLFLKGQTSLSSLDLRDLRKGRRYLAAAAKRSPKFAPASSALARSYQLEWLLTARGDPDLLSQSEHHAQCAVEVDPYEARGFRELGFCSLYRQDFDLSIKNYEKAELLNPHYADIIADYADALVHDGQTEKALQKISRAITLNPLCQDTYYWTLGAAFYFLGQYSDAISTLERMQDTAPVSRFLAAANALGGRLQEAGRHRAKAMEIYPDMTIEGWLRIVSLRDPRHIRHYQEGLKAAGFH